MDDFWQGMEAVRLLATGDRDVWGIILLSLRVSLTATLVSLLLGVPVGAGLALTRFPGRAFVVGLVHAGMGLPPLPPACSSASSSGATARSVPSASSTRRAP